MVISKDDYIHILSLENRYKMWHQDILCHIFILC